MTLKLAERAPHVTTKIPSHTHTHPHSINTHPHLHTSHPQHHLSITIVTMPLKQAVVTYEAFREITNFIRDNGDDWGEFCHNTLTPRPQERPKKLRRRQIERSRTTRMPKIKASSLLSRSSKRTLIASFSSPSNTMTSGGCIRRPKPPFRLLKK